ncbi:hypothetical protein YA0089_26840 [Pseudomonas viridiflava]|uniref:hypothetical protein n=1 Tax=Pseudomonas viridiflava TaxID=33069 RepID=UPI0018E5BC8B|nr:hypothetical protein [Pseudomonas viridiflava]MBI6727236.1 hypothetical protein [Pseudomonas viridiflava]
MTPEQLRILTQPKHVIEPSLSVANISEPDRDRTLIYGNTRSQDMTVHLYLKDGILHCLSYNYFGIQLRKPEIGTSILMSLIVPANIYPAHSDFEVCQLIMDAGISLNLSSHEQTLFIGRSLEYLTPFSETTAAASRALRKINSLACDVLIVEDESGDEPNRSVADSVSAAFTRVHLNISRGMTVSEDQASNYLKARELMTLVDDCDQHKSDQILVQIEIFERAFEDSREFLHASLLQPKD